jgi:hypothetical protein
VRASPQFGGILSIARGMNSLSWPRSSQHAQLDDKSGEADEPLLNGHAACEDGHDVSSDAAILDEESYAHAMAVPDHADSAAAPGKRRMSPFAWLLLAAAVSSFLPLCMRHDEIALTCALHAACPDHG